MPDFVGPICYGTIDQTWTKSASLPDGGTRPDTPHHHQHHHMALWLRATVEMRLRTGSLRAGRGMGQMCVCAGAVVLGYTRGRTQERTAQHGGRMFVFAATLGVQGVRACAMRTRLGENRNFMYAPWKGAWNVWRLNVWTHVQRLLAFPHTATHNACTSTKPPCHHAALPPCRHATMPPCHPVTSPRRLCGRRR